MSHLKNAIRCLSTILIPLSISLPALAETNSQARLFGEAHTSVVVGNGVNFGEGAEDGRSMEWKTYEVRYGREIDPQGLLPQNFISKDGKIYVDVMYYNEGHPENNHRDGYALQLALRVPIDQNKMAHFELATGPYYSMNTTTKNGQQLNDSKVGVLSTAALLYNLDRFLQGLQVRLAMNYVVIPGSPSSASVLVGLEKGFGAGAVNLAPAGTSSPFWVGAMVSDDKTNRQNTPAVHGYAVEIGSRIKGPWAASAQYIHEGGDALVDREGIALEAWWIQPLNENWSISAGAGPYVAVNKVGPKKNETDAAMSLRLGRKLKNGWVVSGDFTRISTFNKNLDRDLFRVEVSHPLK